jgi:hypothetical protein
MPACSASRVEARLDRAQPRRRARLRAAPSSARARTPGSASAELARAAQQDEKALRALEVEVQARVSSCRRSRLKSARRCMRARLAR